MFDNHSEKKIKLNLKDALEISECSLLFDEHKNQLERPVSGICSIADPQPDHIAFTTDKRQLTSLAEIDNAGLAALIVPANSYQSPSPATKTPLLQSIMPLKSIIALVPLVHRFATPPLNIDPRADIDASAKVHETSAVGPYTSIGKNVLIGKNVSVYANVTIEDNCSIGDNCRIHAGAIISKGTTLDGDSMIQNGAVIGSGDNQTDTQGLHASRFVDIGANTCLGNDPEHPTVIHPGTKLDNLVSVGPRSAIGAHTVVCGQAGLGKKTSVGSMVVVGGAVQIFEDCKIADKARFAGSAVVTTSVKKGGDYGGYGPLPKKTWARQRAMLRRFTSQSTEKKTP